MVYPNKISSFCIHIVFKVTHHHNPFIYKMFGMYTQQNDALVAIIIVIFNLGVGDIGIFPFIDRLNAMLKLRRSVCLATVYCFIIKQDFTLTVSLFLAISTIIAIPTIIEMSKNVCIYYQNDCPSLLQLCS